MEEPLQFFFWGGGTLNSIHKFDWNGCRTYYWSHKSRWAKCWVFVHPFCTRPHSIQGGGRDTPVSGYPEGLDFFGHLFPLQSPHCNQNCNKREGNHDLLGLLGEGERTEFFLSRIILLSFLWAQQQRPPTSSSEIDLESLFLRRAKSSFLVTVKKKNPDAVIAVMAFSNRVKKWEGKKCVRRFYVLLYT